MGRKRDDLVWEEFEMTNDGITKCKHCRAEFRGKPSVGRLRSHLLRMEGKGIRSCTLVPGDVKNILADASTSSKRPRIEPPSSINNNDFDNEGQGDNEQQMHAELQCIQDWLKGSDTSAQNRQDNTSVLNAPEQNYEAEIQMQADQEVVQGTDEECSVMAEGSWDGKPFQTEELVGAAFQKNMDIVLEWLMTDEISSIGIYGKEGVGKTTLLKHIHNRILEDKSRFGDVYWITVSQDFSMERLQNLIAESIALDFGNEEDLKKRAARLYKALGRNGKFVLILDDLSDHIDGKEVGIPVGVNGSKLVVVSRSKKVCSWTNCEKEIEVLPLSEEEAWKLFIVTLGHALTPEIGESARSIVSECAGLPLGIVTMAGRMRHVEDINVWWNALEELKKSKVRKDDMEDEVFRILRSSYARLNETALQQCLLYCASYPKDFSIDKEELIKYLVVEGIIKRMDSRKQEFDKGYTMLNTLENFCLLEPRSFGSEVKMHGLIRDMAIQIMKQCSPSMIEAGKQLTRLPEKKCWTEDIVRVSLMNNDIREIPSHYSPRCPNLSTLLFCCNKSLKFIPELFFHNLHGLKVLNLSKTGVEKLPESVAKLENLTALILRGCECLTSLPSLRKLGALEMLDLYECRSFEKLPEGLESLDNLNYLNLLSTGIKELPAGILTNLSHLGFLGFYQLSGEVKVKGEEVGCLHNLETLFWRFNDEEDFNNYMHSFSNMHSEIQQLSQFILFVGPMNDIIPVSRIFKANLYIRWCNMGGEVLLPKDVKELHIDSVSINDRSMCLKNAIDLKKFNISGCKEIEYLFCSSSSSPSIFQTIETLKVSCMEKLRGLFSIEGDDGLSPPTPTPIQLLPIATFSCLKKFKIEACHSMKKLFPCGLLQNLQNLQVIQVFDCSEMEEIITSDKEEGSNSHSIFTHSYFSLPNLRNLYLWELPKLKSICNANLKCDSLEYVEIGECPGLKKISISLPLSSLRKIEVSPKEWLEFMEWRSVEQ